MGLREKRLASDMRAVELLCGPGSPIQVVATSGSPPERYQLRYELPGLVVQDGAVVPIGSHRVEVYLTLGYPRQAPQCRMLTPIFHPNIAPHAICVGDHWSAGESLAALLVRIAEMICFQSYNVKSPLNGDAARWAEEHVHELPLLRRDLRRLPDPAEAAGSARIASAQFQAAPAGAEAAAGRVPAANPEPTESAPRTPETPLPPTIVVSIRPAATRSTVPRGIDCTACGAALTLAPGWTSRWARCPACGRMLTIGG